MVAVTSLQPHRSHDGRLNGTRAVVDGRHANADELRLGDVEPELGYASPRLPGLLEVVGRICRLYCFGSANHLCVCSLVHEKMSLSVDPANHS